MLQGLATALTRWSTRWVPDAWIIAVILSLITYVLGLLFTKSTAYQPVLYWGNGFLILLTFAMQMCLIIVTGYILATTPLFTRILNGLARLPKSPKGAIALMALVSMVLAWLNWGLSIVGSAVFTRFMLQRQRGIDYRLLVATAYLGLGVMWHSGLSGSATLLVATPKHFLEKDVGIIPITETTLHPFNLILAAIVLVALVAFGPTMHPRREETVEADPALVKEAGIGGLVWLWWYFGGKGFPGVNLDAVNFTLLMIGILLHWTPASFLKAAMEAGGFLWGGGIQFPFSAGIFGL